MISSEQDVAGQPGVASGARVAFSTQAYNTIVQSHSATEGELAGLLLGELTQGTLGGPSILVKSALKLELASDSSGFLLDQAAMEELAARTSTGQSAYIIGWFYADPALTALAPRISIASVQALMPADSNLFALVNPSANEGACYLWDGTHYSQAAIEQPLDAGATWTHAPAFAARALGDLLAPQTAQPPVMAPAPPQRQPERVTAPIATGDTVPLPAFLKRKYNLEELSLRSAWPAWAHQARLAQAAAPRRNAIAIFANRRTAVMGLGAFLSIAAGAILVLVGLYSVLSAPQYGPPPPTVTAPGVAPAGPSATPAVVVVVAPTATPTETPTDVPTSTSTSTIEPVPTDTNTPVPTRRPVVPTSTPEPPPPPPPTIEVQPTDTLEPLPTEVIEPPTDTPMEDTATATTEPSPVPTGTPTGPPVPTHRPTPMPGILTPTPVPPTITPLPGIFTPPPAIEPLTPTPET
jgi:hypothetical protein